MPWEKQFDVNEVLDKAMQAFWSRGYEATSMQDLVDRTGINRGSLYSTYKDKHALFLAALRRYAERIHLKRLADLESKYGPREAIRRSFLAFTSQPPEKGRNRGCFLTNTALELAAHDPEAGKIVAEAQKKTEAFYARMIRKGKAEGEVAPHVKTAEAAGALLASLIGVSVLTRSRPGSSLLQTIVDDAVRRLD
jgi:TetR/AcrR family transcriptional regulator, transcriptional repressor for nem operon